MIMFGFMLCSQAFGDSTSASTLTNSMCPVMTDEVVDPDISVDYQGQKVYLCCKKCKKKFLANPTAYLVNLPELVSLSKANADTVTSLPDSTAKTVSEQSTPKISEAPFWLVLIGKFHPLVVHFPIALLFATGLAELAGMRDNKQKMWRQIARFNLSLAGFFAVIAVAFGWAAGASAGYVEEYVGVLAVHRWVGTGTGLMTVAAWILSELSARRPENLFMGRFYHVLLFTSVGLVLLAAHFGGQLIYGLDYFTW